MTSTILKHISTQQFHFCRSKGILNSSFRTDKIEESINAATMIEPRGVFYLFWAYIKQDYFKRKCLKTSPDYVEMLTQAQYAGYSDLDRENLFSLLGVECPSVLIE